jgi:hypothetical protein
MTFGVQRWPFNRSPFSVGRSTVRRSTVHRSPVHRSTVQPFNRSTVQPFNRSTVHRSPFNRSFNGIWRVAFGGAPLFASYAANRDGSPAL